MSINYYFVNKQNKLENDKKLEQLNFINPKEILTKLIDSDLFEELSKLEYTVNNFYDELKQLMQLDNEYIHICQNAGSWNTLFAKTEYYSTYEELFLFYDNNKENLLIVDEYDRELTWLEFEKQISKSERKRGDYICKNGYSWSSSDDFS